MKFLSLTYRLFVLILILPLTAFMYANFDHIEKKPADALRVMTYNIRRDGNEKADERKWINRLPLVSVIIEDTQPDVMGVQEAKQNQIDDLLKQFNNYAAFGKGRGLSWGGKGEDEHCPIFYNKDRISLLEYGTFSINPDFHAVNLFTWAVDYFGEGKIGRLPRICTYGRFKDNKTNKEFYFYNIHLDDKSQSARLNALREIKKHIDERESKDIRKVLSDSMHAEGLPVIITGDFNTQLTSEVMDVLPGYKAAKDMAQKKFGPNDTRTGWQDEESKQIDHILISDPANVRVNQYGVIQSEKPYPSDHRPVIADIVF